MDLTKRHCWNDIMSRPADFEQTGIAIQGMEEEVAMLMKEKGASWVTDEKI